ncbi:MAG: c-type cytochrome domain-containing protein [Gammaproteobacteria bacterium]
MSIRAMPLAASLAIAASLAACEKAEVEQPQPQKATYADDVAPIMQKYCAECHVAGQQGAEATGFLVDSYESIMQGTRSGPLINPGFARTSSLYILISARDKLTVNMPHGKDPLSAEEIETIRVWIDNGAVEN